MTRDDVIKEVLNMRRFNYTLAPEEVFDKVLEALKAEPVKHGHWEKVKEQPYFRKHFHNVACSECHREGIEKWNYCPNCGAKMDGTVY